MSSLLGNTLSAAQTTIGNLGNIVGGRTLLHAQDPDNFEYYYCSLELVDSGGTNQLAFLPFPILPDNIVESKTQIIAQNKTLGGLNLMYNSGFTPFDISLQGSFGRRLRVFFGKETPVDFGTVDTKYWLSLSKNNSGAGQPTNDNKFLIKTGYGLIKMLESMIKASWMDASGEPMFLIFRNYAFNSHYYVEVLNHSYSQTIDRNVIWNYSLSLRAIAPAVTKTDFQSRYQDLMQKSAMTYVGKSLTQLNSTISDALYNGILPPSIMMVLPTNLFNAIPNVAMSGLANGVTTGVSWAASNAASLGGKVLSLI